MNFEEFVKEIASAPRVSGTSGEEKALSYLEECVQSIGFSVRRESFSFQASIPQESYLEVRDTRFEVLPLGYSESGEGSGPIAFTESLESEMLEGIDGSIVVYPDHIFERREYESLLSSNIEGVLLALGDRLADIPTCTMFWERWLESGRLIAATIGKRNLYGIVSGDEATLVSRSIQETLQSANLVWVLDVDGNENVYIFAHQDTAPYAWGVADNACGLAVLLRVCELLKREHIRRNVVFATFGAHELKGASGGSGKFVRNHLSEIEEKGVLAINIDVQGHKLGKNRAVCNTKWLADLVNQLKYRLKYPISTNVDYPPNLDSFFFQRYMPTISFQRTGYYNHSRLGNTLEIVDYESIEKTARAIRELVMEVEKKKIKRRISKKVVEEMSRYLKYDIYDL
jgi:hypothetical protein